MQYSHRLTPFLVTAFIVAAEVAVCFNSALLPNLKADFHVSDQIVQLTMVFGLFALGCSGVVYGGLADSFGRRPMFLISISLFSSMSLVCALAPSITILFIARFLQGVGAGAGWVVGNACLSDIYSGKKYVRVMNHVHAIAGITPAIAPVLGSYLGTLFGWRFCFIALFIISGILAIKMVFWQSETLKIKKKTNAKQFFRDYVTLFHHKTFVKYLVIKVIAVMMIFTEVTNLPLIFVEHLGVAPQHYGFYVFPVFIGYIIASIYSSHRVKHHSVDSTLELGLFLLIISNVILIALSAWHIPLSAWQIQLVKSASYAGWGFIFGNATANIVSAVPGKAGMASAMMIALEMLFSSLGIFLLGFFYDGTIFPLSLFLFLFASIALVSLRALPKERSIEAPDVNY